MAGDRMCDKLSAGRNVGLCSPRSGQSMRKQTTLSAAAQYGHRDCGWRSEATNESELYG